MHIYRSALFSLLLVLSLCAGCVSDAPTTEPDRDSGTSDDADGGNTSMGDADSDLDAAACDTTCTPSCTDNIEVVCEQVRDGCFKETTAACDEGSSCDSGLGACSSCVSCQVGEARCAGEGSTIERCVIDDQGCTQFESSACSSGRCIDEGVEPQCTVDECTLGDGLCMTRDFYRCVENESQTLEFQFETRCDFQERCDSESGCVCRNPCVEGEQSCLQATPRICVTDPSTGCTSWSTDHPCRDATQRLPISCIDPTRARVCLLTSTCFLVEEIQCGQCVTDGSGVKCG